MGGERRLWVQMKKLTFRWSDWKINWTSSNVLPRLEFDAYRSDLEELSLGPRDAAAMVRIEMAQHDHQAHRDKYERLRSDVTIKLKFLEENKVGRKKKPINSNF